MAFMAGDENAALKNEKDYSLSELVHPLAHSLDVKKHPDMVSIPVCYKFSRDFYELYKSLRNLAK
jgi:hypothetical protein